VCKTLEHVLYLQLVYILRQLLIRIADARVKVGHFVHMYIYTYICIHMGEKKEKDLIRIADARVQVGHFVVGKAGEVLLVVMFS
jgi:hypothetical protein